LNVGLPDWTSAFPTAGSWVLSTYDDARQFFALPSALRLASTESGQPDLGLEYIVPGGGTVEGSLYAVIRMGLAFTHDHDSALAEVRKRCHPEDSLVAAHFLPETYWRLEHQAVAPVIREFAWEGGDTARVVQRIPAELGTLIYQGLKSGRLLTRAAIECEVAAFLPRVEEITVSAKTSELLDALRKFSKEKGDPNGVSYNLLLNELVNQPYRFPIKVSGRRSPAQQLADFALAVVGRLRMMLGEFKPAPTMLQAPYIAWKRTDDPTVPAEFFWNLGEPFLARRPWVLDFDPFEGVRELVGKNGIDVVTHVTHVPVSPEAMTELVVVLFVNLPDNTRGVDRLDIDLRIEAKDTPQGRNSFEKNIVLIPKPEQDPPVEVLRFRQPSRKTYSYRVNLMTEDGQRVSGEFSPSSDDHLTIGLHQLPARRVVVKASDRLLQQCVIDARLVGPDGADWVSVTIAPPASAGFLVTPGDLGEAKLEVTATSRVDPSRSIRATFPADSLSLDLKSFPESEAKSVSVTVDITGPDRGALLEILREGADPNYPIVVRFALGESRKVVRYDPHSLFETRYRYRLRPAAGGRIPEWSEFRQPSEVLALRL